MPKMLKSGLKGLYFKTSIKTRVYSHYLSEIHLIIFFLKFPVYKCNQPTKLKITPNLLYLHVRLVSKQKPEFQNNQNLKMTQ